MPEQKPCGMLIKQIHDALERNANNALRNIDLTMAQVGVLLQLKSRPEQGLTLKELEKILHVAQSTAAGIVARLEQKGFVEGFGSLEDKRVKMVRITTAGIKCCLTADDDMKQAEEAMLTGLTEAERILFNTLLQKVSKNVK